MNFPKLNLPETNFDLRQQNGKQFVYDVLRKKYSDENLVLIKNYHPEKIAKLWIELFRDN